MVSLVLSVLLSVLVGVAPAYADSGLSVSSTSRYVFDPQALTVAATMTVTLRNTAPNEPTGDGGFRYFFYNSFGLPLPAAAEQVRATSGGQELSVVDRRIEADPGFRIFEIRFPDLRYPDSRTIDVSFTLRGQPPRSDDQTRIGPGYATFPVFGAGDRGASAVEVVVPADFTVDSTVESFTPVDAGDGTTVYRTEEDNLSPGFAATMSIRGEGVGAERAVTVSGIPLVLVPYPDDPEWADFIEARASVGLPVLMELMGQDWPGDIDRVREDSGSRVRGFEGWYSKSDREIVLGEELEDGVLFHELAHAWVNSDTVEDRWLSEGLAEILAAETAARTDGTLDTPRTVRRDDEAAVALQSWQNSPGFRSTPTDGWAYPASYQVVNGLLEGLTDEELSVVLAEAVTATSAWDLPGQRLLSGGALTTVAFLDLLEHHDVPASADGSAAQLYAEWVLDSADAALLVQRPGALTGYDEFAAIGPWAPPLGVRRAMSTWDYPRATTLVSENRDLAAAAAAVAALSQATQTELPARIQRDYEDADTAAEYVASGASIATATIALERYQQAREVADADRGALGRLGAALLGIEAAADTAAADITGDDFAAAQRAADTAIARAAWADWLGFGVVSLALMAAALAVAVPLAMRRRSARRAQRSAAYPN